jgi:hypothetical protein
MLGLKHFAKIGKVLNKSSSKTQFTKIPKFNFSSMNLDIPTINLEKFINKSQGWEQECKLAAECLHDTGILVLQDSVKFEIN